MKNYFALLVLSFVIGQAISAQPVQNTRLVTVADAWANNSVNAVVFRKNSLVTFRDTQFIAFYDAQRFVVLGKRKIGSDKWLLKQTQYQGNAADAHNMISIMVDGDGYLHIAWDHHNNALRYSRSVQPGSLELLPKMPMTGKLEQKVSYPEFYSMPDGNLLFFYRDGGSGQGNMVINQYDRNSKTWTQLHNNLVDGEGKRNAYWQACVDSRGTVHLSWVWRETPDVASNHDLCYAKSSDGGKTWERSDGSKYQLPINAANAEYAIKIPAKSELINQTSMFADAGGNPFIATYWRDSGTTVPQYHVVYKRNDNWTVENTGFRTAAFSLSGAGTKSIPVSRPQVIAWGKGKKAAIGVVFRDAERGSKISIAIKQSKGKEWLISDLANVNVGSWEPTYDTELWKNKGLLHLFVQNVQQVDGEGIANNQPQPVSVLEWKPAKK